MTTISVSSPFQETEWDREEGVLGQLVNSIILYIKNRKAKTLYWKNVTGIQGDI